MVNQTQNVIPKQAIESTASDRLRTRVVILTGRRLVVDRRVPAENTFTGDLRPGYKGLEPGHDQTSAGGITRMNW